jgi:hypothetical protein
VFEARDAAADDPLSLPSGQDTRTKSADRELKTELIVRLYDDLDDGITVALGKLPLGALRARRSGCQLMTVKSRTAHASDSEWSEANCVGPHPVARFRARDVANASNDESRLDRMIEMSKITQEHDYPLAAQDDPGASAICR